MATEEIDVVDLDMKFPREKIRLEVAAILLVLGVSLVVWLSAVLSLADKGTIESKCSNFHTSGIDGRIAVAGLSGIRGLL